MLTEEQQQKIEQGKMSLGFNPTIREHKKLWKGDGHIFGGTSEIAYEVVNKSANWGKYAQTDETQKPLWELIRIN